MAEAIFTHLAEGGEWKAISAGTNAESEVNPDAVKALEEIGLSPLSEPKPLTPELTSEASVVVTMGCMDECPYIPGKRIIEWDIEDPKDKGIEKYRAIRDELHGKIESLLAEL
jgi:arsenate reductase